MNIKTRYDFVASGLTFLKKLLLDVPPVTYGLVQILYALYDSVANIYIAN